MQDESYTHLLFIDADMGFAPELVERMIAADKPMVGAMAPHRHLDLARLYALAGRIDDVEVARLVAADYVGAAAIGTPDDDGLSFDNLVVDGPCVRVSQTGTGVLLIRRAVFDRIRERYPELWSERIADSYGRFGLTDGVLQCFEPMPDESGLYCSEDTAFCRRWVQGCGGEIWSVVTETITHVGPQEIVGNFLTKLQHGEV